MALSVGVGLAVRFACPVPEALTPRAWTLFAIFASTVTGLVAKPAPVGAWAFMALTFTVATKTLTFQEGLAALTNEVIWLIVVATFFARAFIKTGFGDRLGLLFVKAFGHTTLRLAYGLQTAEAALSPAMPSTTARAAGVFVPVINSLDERTRAYLMGQQLQGGTSPLPYFSPRRRRTSCACRSRRRRESCSRTCSRSGSRRLPSRASSPCSSRPLSSTSSIRLY